ncbi:bifunctional diguanylate cyclase/phosphodiesterase [Pseudohongiella nitratireducens]|uniref:bifunctional diguanylate cyclase/phosphodiesterase n=1 Tax=Pseudohongiella nitratireducens TaxID=1768907 RepID=UPI0030EF29FC
MTVTPSTPTALIMLCSDLFWYQDQNADCLSVEHCSTRLSELGVKIAASCLHEYMSGADRVRWLQLLNLHRSFRDFECQISIDDKPFWLRICATPIVDEEGIQSGYSCLAEDIGEELRQNSRLMRFRAAMDTSLDMIYLVDRETLQFLDVNDTACINTGWSREEIFARGPDRVLNLDKDKLIARYDRLIYEGDSSRLERQWTTPDGRDIVVEVYSRATRIEDRWVIIGVGRDITSRKQVEMRNLRLQNLFSALSLTNEAILRARSENVLFQDACDAVITSGLFTIAAVRVPDENGWFQPVAVAGAHAPDPTNIRVSIDKNNPKGQGISGEAWRSGKASISNDFQHDPRLKPWWQEARELNIGSGAAFPLYRRKQKAGMMLFFSSEPWAFDDQTQSILQSMADNLSFALDSFAAEEEEARAQAAIKASEENLRSLVHLTSDFFWEFDAELRFTRYDGRIVGEANEAAIKGVIGTHLWDNPGVSASEEEWKQFRKTLAIRAPFREFEFAFTNLEGRLYYFSMSGEPVFDEQGEFTGYRGISRDISSKKIAAKRIEHLATHDPLTGLPNRNMFSELLQQQINNARRYPDQAFAILFIDLDRFKTVNDNFGHHMGDALLRDIGERISRPLRSSDIVARLGGDEFVVLLHKIKDRHRARKVAGWILERLSTPIYLKQHEFLISASIGVSIFGEDAHDEETLMKHADTAMYAAKEAGRNNVCCYSSDLHHHAQEQASLALALRHALQREELEVYYQPKVELKTGRVTGVEALLRWHHPGLGQVSPERFIPIAEDNGLILPISDWVLETGLQQLRDWDEMGLPALNIAVNLSARQFSDPNLARNVVSKLRQYEIDAHRLELELTESMVVQDPAHAISVMRSIQESGARLALDDFGTGFSSLGQLRHYPIDTLKIDRTFVQELAEDKQDQAISRAIIAMGKTLGLTVVAEGVENEAQVTFLKQHHCDQIQGYHISRPVPQNRFIAWYRQQLTKR